MSDWLWIKEMAKVYDRCIKTLKPGGTMTLIVKDHMEKRKRVELSLGAFNACLRVGFKPKDWFKWKAPGSVYTSIYRARGWEVVEDEDIIIVQKPAILGEKVGQIIFDEFPNYINDPGRIITPAPA
jgi:hypothetical protein